MRRLFIILSLLTVGALSVQAQQYDRGYEDVPSSPFIAKGKWSVGGTAKYSQHINDGYNMFVISNIDSQGFNISLNPKVMYTLRDNMAVGLKFGYDRSMLDLASADLGVASIEMNASDCYQIQHEYSAYGVLRSYIPFGNSKRVAMFADLHLGGSFKQGKAFNAGGDYVAGTYTEAYTIRLGVDPGFIAFLTDRLAVEVNVGVFGVNYSWQEQIRNQVEHTNAQSTSAGFMINLLSLGVGISYYIL